MTYKPAAMPAEVSGKTAAAERRCSHLGRGREGGREPRIGLKVQRMRMSRAASCRGPFNMMDEHSREPCTSPIARDSHARRLSRSAMCASATRTRMSLQQKSGWYKAL